MKSFIVIGPKKTATSSIYTALKNVEGSRCFFLWPKESNYFIKKPLKYFLGTRLPFIDISPQYYTSFRALMKIKRLKSKGFDIDVVVLKREPCSRISSHFNYMFTKGEISDSWVEYECETLMLSNYRFFEDIGLEVIELTVAELSKVLKKEYGISSLPVPVENSGDFSVRSIYFKRALSIAASFSRRTKAGRSVVEYLSPLLRKLVYKRGSRTENQLVLGKECSVSSIVDAINERL